MTTLANNAMHLSVGASANRMDAPPAGDRECWADFEIANEGLTMLAAGAAR